MDCDGTETICISLTDEAEATAAGARVAGGTFSAQGFQPSNGGGLDWTFGAGRFREGRMLVDVTGLTVIDADEGSGGKVSIFDACASEHGQQDYLGLQKMTFDYHDGHNFRYGLDDDGLADNWDALVLTASDYSGYYSARDWTADQTHQFEYSWSRAGLWLRIDDYEATSPGHADVFDAAGTFVLANRCQHYDNQQAPAWFSNFHVWLADEEDHEEPEDTGGDSGGDTQVDTGSTPTDTGDSGTGDSGTGDSGADSVVSPCMAVGAAVPLLGQGADVMLSVDVLHCQGGSALVDAAVAIGNEPTSGSVRVDWRQGLLWMDGASCGPGTTIQVAGSLATLDCSRSAAIVTDVGVTLTLALTLAPSTLVGTEAVWLAAEDATDSLGWTQIATWTVAEVEPDISGCSCGVGSGWAPVGGLLAVLGATRRKRQPRL